MSISFRIVMVLICAYAGWETAIEAATELLAKYPMLQVEIYDASSKSRTLVKQQ